MPFHIEDNLIHDAVATTDGLDRLIAAVWPEAYRIAYSILQDRGLAEDAAQDACASIARSLDTLKESKLFRAWSYKIITNHALTAARRRPQTQPLDAVTGHGVAVDAAGALDLALALRKLPPEQRAAIILHYYGGLNSREIASAIGLPSSTIRFHLMLARRTLRKALSETEITHSREEAISHVQ